MAKVTNGAFWVASAVDLDRARLAARLPHRRRHDEINSFRLRDVLRAWRLRRAIRRELHAIDDDLVRDAGLDPRVVRREVAKPFWRPIDLDRAGR